MGKLIPFAGRVQRMSDAQAAAVTAELVRSTLAHDTEPRRELVLPDPKKRSRRG